MKTQKVAEAIPPVMPTITNQEALTHLLSQIEWWHYAVALALIGVTILLLRASARKSGMEVGVESGRGLLRALTIDARYEMLKVRPDQVVCLLRDLDSGEERFHLLDAGSIVGGASTISSATAFQAIATHGGDRIQLCKLEVIPDPERPKLRQRFVARLKGIRGQAEAAEA